MLDELLSHGYKIPFHLVVKCKELLQMEKEQKIEAYIAGSLTGCGCYDYMKKEDGEQYYNKTYGGNNAD